MNRPPTIAIATTLLLAACAGLPAPDAPGVAVADATDDTRQVVGTIEYLDLEGGLFVIRDAAGATLNPTNLAAEFEQDGLPIRASVRASEAMASIGMVGELVDIVEIEATGEAQPAMGRVSGTVSYRERIALPGDATVLVTLADVSKVDVQADTIAEAVIETGGRQVPIPFQLDYSSADIDDRHTYAVRAVIRHGERPLFTTDTAHHVITRGNPTEVDLILVRVTPVSPEYP